MVNVESCENSLALAVAHDYSVSFPFQIQQSTSDKIVHMIMNCYSPMNR